MNWLKAGSVSPAPVLLEDANAKSVAAHNVRVSVFILPAVLFSLNNFRETRDTPIPRPKILARRFSGERSLQEGATCPNLQLLGLSAAELLI